MSTERELTLERNLDDARRCHSAKVDEVKRLKRLLADWMAFEAAAAPGTSVYEIILEDLKRRTLAELQHQDSKFIIPGEEE